MKRCPLQRKTPLARTSNLLTSKPLERVSELKRTSMKRKPRRARKGDDKPYLAFIRQQPCVVLDRAPCLPAVPHHAIEMGGDELAGMGSTAPDSDAVPLCRKHHRQFHLHQGFCRGWSKEQRKVFQQDEIARLNSIWADLTRFGITQEPERRAC